MNSILDVLTQNILPIFLVAGLGYWLYRVHDVEPRPVASVVFNIFSPCLVFVSLVNSRLPGDDLLRLSLFTVLTVLAMGAIAVLVGRALRMNRSDLVVLLLTVMFVNGGNYGLTLNQLRYGDEGLARAIVYYIVSTMLVYTVGVVIASAGRSSWRSAVVKLAQVPAFYAVLLAIFFYSLEVPVPGPVMRALEIAAAGAIPAMIVVLGMNIAAMDGLASWRLALPAVSLRLLLAPLVAVLVASGLRLTGLDFSVSIIEASMPTAVITTVIATEFDVQAPLVTSIVVFSTLLSPLTLALTITLIGL